MPTAASSHDDGRKEYVDQIYGATLNGYDQSMRGIQAWGSHIPYRRLDRAEIAAVAGSGGGKGTRTVAGFDEDATTMAAEAARAAMRSVSGPPPSVLWFSTTTPPYLDKTNANAIHASLRLPRSCAAFDALGSVRSTMGTLHAALHGTGSQLATAGDLRSGRAGSADESTSGDAGAAVLVGDEADGPVLAELLDWASATEEFTDRWRPPTEVHSKLWEDRFGETRYLELGIDAWNSALAQQELSVEHIDHVVVASTHVRAGRSLLKKLGVDAGVVLDDLAATVGVTGAAHPLLLLSAALEAARPDQTIALVVLADGADVVLLRTTDALARHDRPPSVKDQIATGAPIPYGKFLAWRHVLDVEPPRRPEPTRPSSSAAARSLDWKYGFVGSADDQSTVHLPPSPGDHVVRPMADVAGTVATFTVDRLAYSPSPPIVFAVVDFDGGGRLPIELTDVDAEEMAIGMRVELTFRRLFSADGIHNYFWKGRPVRGEQP